MAWLLPCTNHILYCGCYTVTVLSVTDVSRSVFIVRYVVVYFRPVLHADIVITHKEPVTSAKYNGAFRQVLTCSEGSVSAAYIIQILTMWSD